MKKHNTARRLVCLLLAAALLVPLCLTASAAAGEPHFTISNPYDGVDWGTWGAYRANLHTHTFASDGPLDVGATIEAYYAEGYDVLALTDHGVVSHGWDVTPQTVPLISFKAIFTKPKPLTAQRSAEIALGTDRGGRGMTEVPLGIEQNAASMTLAHVNTFFADYGQGKWGKENDFEGPIAAVDALGGISHINHPGDWTGAKDDPAQAKNPENVRFFGTLLKKYPSCLGVEIVNGTETSTRNDRIFWDSLLEYMIPSGRNVWAFANADAHETESLFSAFEVLMMPANNQTNVRAALENGTFFACSRLAFNELGEDFVASGPMPSVRRITVDAAEETIAIEGADCDSIQWISRGEVIATGGTIDLNDYESEIGRYVRAQLKGPGGICWTQAFVTDDGSALPVEPEPTPFQVLLDRLIFEVKSTRLYVILSLLIRQFG